MTNSSDRYDDGHVEVATNVSEALLRAQRGKALSEAAFQQPEAATVQLISTL